MNLLRDHATKLIQKKEEQRDTHARQHKFNLSEERRLSCRSNPKMLPRSREILAERHYQRATGFDPEIHKGGVPIDRKRSLKTEGLKRKKKIISEKQKTSSGRRFEYDGRVFNGFEELRPEFQLRLSARRKSALFDSKYSGRWEPTNPISADSVGKNKRSRSARGIKNFREKLKNNEMEYSKFGLGIGIQPKKIIKPRYLESLEPKKPRLKSILKMRRRPSRGRKSSQKPSKTRFQGSSTSRPRISTASWAQGLDKSAPLLPSYYRNPYKPKKKVKFKGVNRRRRKKDFNRKRLMNEYLEYRRSLTPDFSKKTPKKKKKRGKWYCQRKKARVEDRVHSEARSRDLRVKVELDNQRKKMDRHKYEKWMRNPNTWRIWKELDQLSPERGEGLWERGVVVDGAKVSVVRYQDGSGAGLKNRLMKKAVRRHDLLSLLD